MSQEEKTDIRMHRQGNVTFAQSSVGCYVFEITGDYRLAQPSVLPFYTRSRTLVPVKIDGHEIIPYGEQNNYPDQLREILDENNLTPEVLNKQAQLLWGQGPALYRTIFEDGKRHKHWVSDPAIKAWLTSWDYEDYLLKAAIEFRTINGHFTKFVRNRGPRIGRPGMITRLEHVSSVFSRCGWPDENWIINNIVVGDFSQPWKQGLKSYPVFDAGDPFAYPIAMRYSNLYSFALDHEYSRAPWHGTINWIKLSSSIARLLSAFNLNSAAIKYHVKSPALYWDQKKEMLEQKCIDTNVPYNDKMLEKLKDDTFKKITEALSGAEKVGKMVTTETIFDPDAGEYVGWEIDVLDQKVKEFIDAQINIAARAAFETTSGIGLHPALSNLSKDGNLPSGSEQLYAFKLYLSTGVDIPESIVTKDINLAIQANFPGTDLRIGFYHDNVLTEEATNPGDRVKNQSSSYKEGQQKNNQARCGKCGHVFDYNSRREAGMGYVECPGCGEAVTQKDIV
jgi:hypothetical protein